MTDTATRSQEGSSGEAHGTDPAQDQGGSPNEQGDRVVGADGEPIEETAEPAEDVQDAPETAADDDRIAELERDIQERDAILDSLSAEMDRNPELRAMLDGTPSNGRPAANEEDWLGSVESALRDPETGLTRDAADVVMRAFSPALQRLQQLEQESKVSNRRLSGLARSVGSTEFSRGLANEGVTAETQKAQPFQKFLRTMRGSPSFQRMEARDPRTAADYAAAKWTSSRARKSGFRDERTRLETAKGGKDVGVSRGSSVAEKIHEIRRDGSHIDRAFKIRLKDPDAKIRYVDA